MQCLPSLHNLSLHDKRQDVDASWAWDPGSYQVRFSVDVAVIEQIDGLGQLNRGGIFVPKTYTNRPHQLPPIAVLRVAIEYTIQRIWDVECAVPWINVEDDMPANPDAGKKVPFVDNASSLVRTVAKMTLAVKETLTAKQAQTAFAQRQKERTAQGTKRQRPQGTRQSERQQEQESANTEAVEVDTEEEEEEPEEDDDDDDTQEPTPRRPLTDYEIRLNRETRKITRKINTLKGLFKSRRNELRSLLVDLEEEYERVLGVVEGNMPEESNGFWQGAIELSEDEDQRLAEWLVRNKYNIIKSPISSLRQVPPPSYYGQRTVNVRKYVRWVKIETSLFDATQVASGTKDKKQDFLYDIPVTHTIEVPRSLDGSFFSGDVDLELEGVDRIADLEMEHVLARSHLKNCKLVREMGDPDHLAFMTVFSSRAENSSKGDKYLPLSDEPATYARMIDTTASVWPIDSEDFGLSRRMMASRAVCAGYLTLFMVERKPDANTELGSRYGGVYFTYLKDVLKLMKGVDMITLKPDDLYADLEDYDERRAAVVAEDRKEVRQKWQFEVGLALLQWHYLVQQPYNPLPWYAYRNNAGLYVEDVMMPFYEDLLARRFSNTDMLSEMLRREMAQEVANAPLRERKLDLDNRTKLRDATSKLKDAVEPLVTFGN